MKTLLFIFFFLICFIFVVNVRAANCIQDPNQVECKFGTITPPSPLASFIPSGSTGAWAISSFLSALIALFYSIAAIVLIFMLIWGAFEWLTSGGDKEKIASARMRIISAIVGMILFAITFAVIAILGRFTGFEFFQKQQSLYRVTTDSSGQFTLICKNGTEYHIVSSTANFASLCK